MEPKIQQMQNEIDELKSKLDNLNDLYFRIFLNDKIVLQNPLYLKDGSTMFAGSITGSKIGATGEKIGFLGHTPVVRQSAITAPTGGATIDSQARTAIGTIITVLQSFGLTS